MLMHFSIFLAITNDSTQAFDAANKITDDSLRLSLYSSLESIDHTSAGNSSKALKAATNITDETLQDETYSCIAMILMQKEEFEKANAVAGKIIDKIGRNNAHIFSNSLF